MTVNDTERILDNERVKESPSLFFSEEFSLLLSSKMRKKNSFGRKEDISL
jgi:hypothetical protein